jgi:transcriptional regulator with XRE-family HTH domain
MLDTEALRLRRLELRLTQAALGKAIGQDQAYISRLERGDFQEITVTTLERLAAALRVTPNDLLEGSEWYAMDTWPGPDTRAFRERERQRKRRRERDRQSAQTPEAAQEDENSERKPTGVALVGA